LLLAALAAVIFAPPESDGVVAPVQTTHKVAINESRVQQVANKTSNEEILSIHPRGADEELGSAFVPGTWMPPPTKAVHPPKEVAVIRPPEPPPVPLEPPKAPPLPFHVLGQYIEDGAVAVFLQHNDQNLVVRKGDLIDGTYKIESIAGNTVTFVYLPLEQKQTLAVGDTN